MYIYIYLYIVYNIFTYLYVICVYILHVNNIYILYPGSTLNGNKGMKKAYT